MLLNTAREIVLWPTAFLTYVQVSCYAIGHIFKLDVAKHLVMTCANQGISKCVLLIVKDNFGAICKLTNFLTTYLQFD